MRGLREDMIDSETGTDQNPGNFIAFMHEIAQYCPDLDNHLKNPLMKHATYTSPKSQNEMIDVTGIKTIQQQLINEIKDAKFHAIMADVTSMNDEILVFILGMLMARKTYVNYFYSFSNLSE